QLTSLDWLVAAVFSFQAEDGIRGLTVTGVQTCALPIWRRPPPAWPPRCATIRASPPPTAARLGSWRPPARVAAPLRNDPGLTARSEERRVGKECRARRWRHHWQMSVPRRPLGSESAATC